MVEFLVLQIRMGKLTLDKVPEKWLAAVKERLNIQDGGSNGFT